MIMTQRRPLVTIVIPAYNHEQYVSQAIESVLDQHYTEWELLVINDGSTDNTGKECEKYAGHERVQVIHQENIGLSNTLNKALDLAKGDYFGFLPSDDLFYPEKLLVQVDFLELHKELAGVGGKQTLIDHQGSPLKDKDMEEWFSYIPSSRADFLLKLLERNFVPAPSMLLRTNIVRDVGGFDPECKFMQDYDLWFRILKHHDMKILPRPLIYYRWHGKNLTFKATSETEAERARVFEKAARLLEITDLYPELWTELRPEVIALCRIDLHKRLCVNPTPNFEEIHGIFDEKFTSLWRKRKKLQVPEVFLQKVVPQYLENTSEPSIIFEVTSLDKGGLEQVVYDLTLGFWKKDVPVTVVCTREGGFLAEKLKKKGIRVEVLPLNDKEKAYKHIISEINARLINAHYSHFGAKIAFELGIPFVSTIHNIYAWLPAFVKDGIREMDPLVCHYVAVSDDVKAFSQERFGIQREKITVIPNGLDISRWERSLKKWSGKRSDLGFAKDDFIFLTIAAISRVKGHDRIIRALSLIASECPKAKAVFIGQEVDDAFSIYIKNLVKELGLNERVIFHPFDEETARWYCNADAFVLPSLLEGWSIAMLEAMFAGLPIIMTQVAGAKTAITEADSGILIPPPFEQLGQLETDFLERYTMITDDPSVPHLAEAMLEFYKNQEKWKEKGLKGKELVVTKYNLHNQVDSHEKLFNKIIIDFSSRYVAYFNSRLKNLEKALDFSQRTIEKVYESQRQGYWLQTLNQQLHEAWNQISKERERQAELLHQINTLQDEIKVLRQTVDTIYSSKGWQLLKLARKLKRTDTN